MKPTLALMAALALAVPAFAQQSGWIGVSITEQPDRGVLVRSVEANSPAEKAGIKANDVITQFNRQEVTGVLQMQRMVNETPVGRAVDVVVRRDKIEQTLKVTSEKSPFPGLQIHAPDFHFPNVDSAAIRDRIITSVRPLELTQSVTVSNPGVRVDSLTAQLRDFFGVKAGEGVLVASVDGNSDAAKAGLMAGDVITAVGGSLISTPQDFNREVRSKTSAFTLKVIRNKQEREIRVE